jgi:hypothetical protein
MRDLNSFLQAYNGYIFLGILVIDVFLAAFLAVLWRRLSRLVRRYNTKIADGNVGQIVDCLAQQTQAISLLESRLDDLNAKLNQHSEDIAKCFQRIGIVRFDAFEDVGGEQSFALVLLNGKGNGFALSSLYGREESRVYAKRITDGQSDRAMSDEEKAALSKAMNPDQPNSSQ